MNLNLIALVCLVPAIISFPIAWEANRRKYAPLGRLFSLLMLTIGVWSITYAMELASTSQAMMQFWLKLEYVAIPWVSFLMFIVVINFWGSTKRTKPIHIFALGLIPLITMLLAITHEKHQLYYKSVQLATDGPIPLLKLEKGIWYNVHTIYSYLLNFASIVILVRALHHQEPVYRRQILFFLLGVMLPLMSFTLYYVGLMPIKNIDPTPFAFTGSGVLMWISIRKFRMLDLMPIAREHIFRSISDGLLIFDSRQQLVDCNPMASKIFGWDKPPLGKSLKELLPNEYDNLAKLFEQTESETLEIKIESNAKEQWYQVNISKILNYRQRVVGHLMVAHDFTKRHFLEVGLKESDAQLRKTIDEKDKFFSIVAHDLRSPIGSFLRLTELSIDEGDNMSREEMREITTSMNKSAENLYALLDNLLQWSLLQRNMVSAKPEKIDLQSSVSFIHQLYLNAALLKNITLTLHIPEPIELMADINMLHTILRNLISNAIKFTYEGGQVEISIGKKDEHMAYISVKDTGIGMKQEMIAQLFMLNAKVNRSGTAGEPSTGLGLILCKELAERNNGWLTVSSEPQKGSVFTLYLPLAH